MTNPILTFSWVKRCGTRGRNFSHSEVVRAFKDKGYTVQIVPDSRMIAYIHVYTLGERKEFHRILNSVLRGFHYKVDLYDENWIK